MKNYNIVFIGGGMTGSAAVMGIRKNDDAGTIAMFSEEPFGPYTRPPLSKGLWTGKEIDDIVRPMNQYNIDLYLKTRIVTIDPKHQNLVTHDGERFGYEKLLLATGGQPIHLPESPEGVIYYRTRSDYHKLRELVNDHNDFCVIGGGFISSEIAAALAKQNKSVTMIFPETGISGLVFPEDLSNFVTHYYEEKGVEVLPGNFVNEIVSDQGKYTVHYEDHNTKIHDERRFAAVIAGIGINPNIDLAKTAGIDVGDGILVNEYLQTNVPTVFSAGDVANFHIPLLKKRLRVEHEDNANTMGMQAGENMSGEMHAYDHLPFFYSDLFDLGYEAIGEINKDLDVYEDWIEPFKKGTIFYLKEGRIKGLLFWNLWGKVDEGRERLLETKTYTKQELTGMFTD